MPHVAPPTLLRAGPPHKSHRGQWSHQLSNNGDHQGRCKVGKNKNINKYSSRNATLLLQHRFNRKSETWFSPRTQIWSFLVLVTHTVWKSQNGLSFCKLTFLIKNYSCLLIVKPDLNFMQTAVAVIDATATKADTAGICNEQTTGGALRAAARPWLIPAGK